MKSQDSPFVSNSQFACSYKAIPRTRLYPAQSAAVTIAIDHTDTIAFLFGAAAQAKKAGLHSNSINATLSFSTENEGVQSCSQWSWEKNFHWDEMMQRWAPMVHT